MKIIMGKQNNDAINVSEITEEHIVVAIISGKPTILIAQTIYNRDKFFLSISSQVLLSNGYYNIEESSIESIIEFHLNNGAKIECFHQDEWREALQWLIDNAE